MQLFEVTILIHNVALEIMHIYTTMVWVACTFIYIDKMLGF